MDPLDAENAALEQRIAQLETQLGASSSTPVESTPSSYGLKQFIFDVPTGITRAVAGTADVLSYPFVKGLELAGAPIETFGATKTLNALLEPNVVTGQPGAAEILGVRPNTEVQRAVEFVTPTLGGKAAIGTSLGRQLAKELALGGIAYGGTKAGEAIAPESPYAGAAGSLAALMSTGAAAKGLATLAGGAEQAGKGLQRSALGARASDYTKQAKNQIIEDVPGDFQTQLKKSLDNVIENKTLGTTTNPEQLYSNLQEGKDALEETIQNKLKQVDAERTTGIIPRLDKTLEWIKTKAPADKVDFYKEKVNNFLKALKDQGQGSLVYLNQQKKAIGEHWKSSPETDPTFWRRFYTDVKDTIETHVPDVKNLNKQKRDLLVIEPVIERGKRLAEQVTTPQKLTKALLYTTGGLGVPAAAAAVGSVPVGLGLAGALGLLGTSKGQQLLGKGLSQFGNVFSGITPDATRLVGEAIRGTRPLSQELNTTKTLATPSSLDDENKMLEERIKQLEGSFSNKETIVPKETPLPESTKYSSLIKSTAQKHGVDPSLVHAVAEQESRFNPKAKGPKTKYGHAVGMMQIMESNLKAMGIKNPLDAKTNIEAGTKILADNLKQFGDEKLALAAYNWRPGALRNQLKMLNAKGIEPTWDNLVAYGDIPAQTRKYVPSVIKRKQKYLI